jgi:hypothetical protein
LARIERVITLCDLHEGEADGRKVPFVIAERIYVVDACEDHKAQLLSAVRLVEQARSIYVATAPKLAGSLHVAKRKRSRF